MPKQLTEINDIVLNGIYDAFDLGFVTGRNGEQVAQSEEMIRLQAMIDDLEERNTNLREILDTQVAENVRLEADRGTLSDTNWALNARIDDLEERNTSLEHSLSADIAIMEAQEAYIASLQESLATIHNLTT